MSERGAFRGRGGGRGDHRGGRGGGRGGAQGGNAAGQQQTERPKKENILDLSKYMDKQITVKFSGGREGEFCRREGASKSRCSWMEGGMSKIVY
jgi:U6 snRNA-associated Sm-like protein LSm7